MFNHIKKECYCFSLNERGCYNCGASIAVLGVAKNISKKK